MPRHKLFLVVAIVAGLVALSAGIAVAASGGSDPSTPTGVSEKPGDNNGTEEAKADDETTLTGDVAAKASDAALAATGGGTVLAVEPDDGNAGYEVEIRKADGSEAEVQLDKDFRVVNREEDD